MNRETRIVEGLRSYLRNLSKRRSDRVVTADDAHQYLNRRGISERRYYVRMSYINSVLRRPDFRPSGRRTSQREAARYRRITAWRAR